MTKVTKCSFQTRGIYAVQNLPRFGPLRRMAVTFAKLSVLLHGVKLIRKLRWLGLDEEAERVEDEPTLQTGELSVKSGYKFSRASFSVT